MRQLKSHVNTITVHWKISMQSTLKAKISQSRVMLHLIIKINSTFIYLYMCLVFIFNTTPEIQTPSGKNAIQVSAASIKSCRFHFKVEMTKSLPFPSLLIFNYLSGFLCYASQIFLKSLLLRHLVNANYPFPGILYHPPWNFSHFTACWSSSPKLLNVF